MTFKMARFVYARRLSSVEVSPGKALNRLVLSSVLPTAINKFPKCVERAVHLAER
jgi:hypothetical protein